MRGYGQSLPEWINNLTDKQLKEIRKRANPPNGQTISDYLVIVLERDLRAVLAAFDRVKLNKSKKRKKSVK